MHTRYSGTNTQSKLIKSAFGGSEQALTTGSNLGGDLLKVCHSRAELTLRAEAARRAHGECEQLNSWGGKYLFLHVRKMDSCFTRE